MKEQLLKVSIFLIHNNYIALNYGTVTKNLKFESVKLTGKLQNGTVFVKKGHDEGPFEWKIDEGELYFHHDFLL